MFEAVSCDCVLAEKGEKVIDTSFAQAKAIRVVNLLDVQKPVLRNLTESWVRRDGLRHVVLVEQEAELFLGLVFVGAEAVECSFDRGGVLVEERSPVEFGFAAGRHDIGPRGILCAFLCRSIVSSTQRIIRACRVSLIK